MLREDAPMVCVRRAVKELMGMQLKELGPRLGWDYSELANNIAGRRHNRRAQEGLARAWGIPRGGAVAG